MSIVLSGGSGEYFLHTGWSCDPTIFPYMGCSLNDLISHFFNNASWWQIVLAVWVYILIGYKWGKLGIKVFEKCKQFYYRRYPCDYNSWPSKPKVSFLSQLICFPYVAIVGKSWFKQKNEYPVDSFTKPGYLCLLTFLWPFKLVFNFLFLFLLLVCLITTRIFLFLEKKFSSLFNFLGLKKNDINIISFFIALKNIIFLENLSVRNRFWEEKWENIKSWFKSKPTYIQGEPPDLDIIIPKPATKTVLDNVISEIKKKKEELKELEEKQYSLEAKLELSETPFRGK